MASFRSPEKQAEKAVARVLAIGSPRHGNRDDGKIHSLRTADAYRQSLRTYAEWRAEAGLKGGIDHTTKEQALQYLRDRASAVGQKQLDLDRQALRILPNLRSEALDRIKTEVQTRGLAEASRAYTADQVAAIAAHQRGPAALATEIAHAAGLRAHELLTLLPAAERAASSHREWAPERFNDRAGTIYTVQGKGGLVREVLIPKDLADRLEATRLPAPRETVDRGIRYTQHYGISGGQRWSQSFSEASRRALGWSTGAHGLRHAYAQRSMEGHQQDGKSYRDALGLASQEMGHFRPDITVEYLR